MRDVEAVEGVERFVSGAAGNMRLTGEVADDAGNQRQGFADVARGGVRDINDLLRVERLRVGDLGGINLRRGGDHVHAFLHLLHVRQVQIEMRDLGEAEVRAQGVEAVLIDGEAIGPGRRAEGAAAGVVGFATQRRRALQLDDSPGDANAVFVGDGEPQRGGLPAGGGGQQEQANNGAESEHVLLSLTVRPRAKASYPLALL